MDCIVLGYDRHLDWQATLVLDSSRMPRKDNERTMPYA